METGLPKLTHLPDGPQPGRCAVVALGRSQDHNRAMTAWLVLILLASVEGVAPQASGPPQWSAADRAPFFDDAFAELQGERPSFQRAPPAEAARDETAAKDGPADANDAVAWNTLVSAEVLETEVKRQATLIRDACQSPERFKAGGNRQFRDAALLIAQLMQVIGEYPETIRWRESAPAAAQLLARSGANARTASDAVFRDAQARGEDLQRLLRGERLEAPTGDDSWPAAAADRGVAMRRMELAHAERLPEWLGLPRGLARHAGELEHEAEVLAALAVLVTREGYPDADSPNYVELGRALRDASVALREAVQRQDGAGAETALRRAGQACAACHDAYRG
jgi:hypothetical protein